MPAHAVRHNKPMSDPSGQTELFRLNAFKASAQDTTKGQPWWSICVAGRDPFILANLQSVSLASWPTNTCDCSMQRRLSHHFAVFDLAYCRNHKPGYQLCAAEEVAGNGLLELRKQ
jgi:hypothetical protein